MENWRIEAEKLSDINRLKSVMDIKIQKNPDFYRKRMKLLDEFFSKHPSPVDIVVILYSGLSDAYRLAYHLEGNNMLFYRPKASHKKVIDNAFLEGTPHPDRVLLIYDNDMVTGDAMKETADCFKKLGYLPSNIFGYLDGGCEWRQYNAPELMNIEDLLRK